MTLTSAAAEARGNTYNLYPSCYVLTIQVTLNFTPQLLKLVHGGSSRQASVSKQASTSVQTICSFDASCDYVRSPMRQVKTIVTSNNKKNVFHLSVTLHLKVRSIVLQTVQKKALFYSEPAFFAHVSFSSDERWANQRLSIFVVNQLMKYIHLVNEIALTTRLLAIHTRACAHTHTHIYISNCIVSTASRQVHVVLSWRLR